jgi:hypothetical protein
MEEGCETRNNKLRKFQLFLVSAKTDLNVYHLHIFCVFSFTMMYMKGAKYIYEYSPHPALNSYG